MRLPAVWSRPATLFSVVLTPFLATPGAAPGQVPEAPADGGSATYSGGSLLDYHPARSGKPASPAPARGSSAGANPGGNLLDLHPSRAAASAGTPLATSPAGATSRPAPPRRGSLLDQHPARLGDFGEARNPVTPAPTADVLDVKRVTGLLPASAAAALDAPKRMARAAGNLLHSNKTTVDGEGVAVNRQENRFLAAPRRLSDLLRTKRTTVDADGVTTTREQSLLALPGKATQQLRWTTDSTDRHGVTTSRRRLLPELPDASLLSPEATSTGEMAVETTRRGLRILGPTADRLFYARSTSTDSTGVTTSTKRSRVPNPARLFASRDTRVNADGVQISQRRGLFSRLPNPFVLRRTRTDASGVTTTTEKNLLNAARPRNLARTFRGLLRPGGSRPVSTGGDGRARTVKAEGGGYDPASAVEAARDVVSEGVELVAP